MLIKIHINDDIRKKILDYWYEYRSWDYPYGFPEEEDRIADIINDPDLYKEYFK